jgi:hypothetical protein
MVESLASTQDPLRKEWPATNIGAQALQATAALGEPVVSRFEKFKIGELGNMVRLVPCEGKFKTQSSTKGSNAQVMRREIGRGRIVKLAFALIEGHPRKFWRGVIDSRWRSE